MPYKDPDAAKQYLQGWLAKNRDRLLVRNKANYEANKLERRAAARANYWANHEQSKAASHTRHRRSKAERKPLAYKLKQYGTALTEYDRMVENQAGLCAICCTPMRPDGGTCVDHDHQTGAVRGLLCGQCNAGIGLLQDCCAVAYSASAYLTDRKAA